ncbi:EAL domain-containing protein [Gorillibacterium sp. CAU 1737]|uniref:putative bifunctional diguanylate cyclase/phosphodiesterase n=1 Tax=Gorillibacterium sp. CAU 1737 TaxID=3140362 RepID=UPI00326124AE
MKDNNKLTNTLYVIGIAGIIHFIYYLALDGDWKLIVPFVVLASFAQLVPIVLSGSAAFVGNGIINLFLLIEYGIGASLIAIISGLLTFFVVYSPNKRKINWFRFICNIGMFYISVTISYYATFYIPDPYRILHAILCYTVYELSSVGFNWAIERSLKIPNRRFQFKSFIKLLLPFFLGMTMFLKIIMQQLYFNQLVEIAFAIIILMIINRYTNTLNKQNRLLEESNQRYKSLFEQNPDLVFTLDNEHRLTSANPMLETILGYKESEVLDKPFDQALHILELDRFQEKIMQMQSGIPQHFPLTIYHKNGMLREFDITSGPTIVDNVVVGGYGIAKDRTADKEAERIIHRMAYFDSVTGLPNRAYFYKKLSELIQTAEETGGGFGMLYLDLDQFKNINDTQGHLSGDNLLVQVSRRLLETVQSASFISRLGGDEFTVLLSHVKGPEDCNRVARMIRQALSSPFVLNGQDVYITTSIGISLFPDSGTDSQTLVKNADAAMYKAKDSGGDSYCLYSAELQKAIEDRLTLQTNLRKALEKKEFKLVYQPQLDLNAGAIIGVEALIRWDSPELGEVPPTRFIPEAERCMLIIPIGEWVLREACRQSVEWQKLGYPPISMSVNLSSVQFQGDDIVNTVRTVLYETGLSPRYLELEITEGILLQNTNRTMRILRELKDLGVRISIDDFGIGYSSLSYLKHFPFDTLKIDRSFIQEMMREQKDRLIIGTLIHLAHNLEMKVVAEGVETEEQMESLTSWSCDLAQGYFISRPLSPSHLEEGLWINKSMLA